MFSSHLHVSAIMQFWPPAGLVMAEDTELPIKCGYQTSSTKQTQRIGITKIQEAVVKDAKNNSD